MWGSSAGGAGRPRGYDRGVGGSSAAVSHVIIDCNDPERLASFWGALLGRAVVARTGPYVWLSREEGLGMGFQQVADPKIVKNRLHLDLATPDLMAERRRVEQLGGRRAEGYEAGGFLVMADPEGNEFCLIPEGRIDVDDQGRATYGGEGLSVPTRPDR
jgi:predicted enzyme related to lactoylglutathione lyase